MPILPILARVTLAAGVLAALHMVGKYATRRALISEKIAAIHDVGQQLVGLDLSDEEEHRLGSIMEVVKKIETGDGLDFTVAFRDLTDLYCDLLQMKLQKKGMTP